MKRLPEEGQILCLTTFDPWTTRDGSSSTDLVHDSPAVQERLIKNAEATYLLVSGAFCGK